ncbi:hypothetical protein JXA88_06140 [Candidatus Fermentibacteria bacterium]|nr:hypothetical protein [Candidatus Fermentibacteria bacterium]
MPDPQAVVIADANVLIDYAVTSPDLLGLISTRLWVVHVPRPVFDEVDQLDEHDAARLSLAIVEPSLGQLVEAGTRGGRLSRQDRLCFVMARDNRWRCWTNDTGLRKLCRDAQIRTYWGLEPMILLCQQGYLQVDEATRTARMIHDINRYHLSGEILERFLGKLDQIEGERG